MKVKELIEKYGKTKVRVFRGHNEVINFHQRTLEATPIKWVVSPSKTVYVQLGGKL